MTYLEAAFTKSSSSVSEILKNTPPDALDEAVSILKNLHSNAEIRQGLIDLLSVIPLEYFGAVKAVYLSNFS
jgi:hypothetical protein